MMVRFFGGWDYIEEDAQTRQPAKAGYAKGVPMGGDLSRAPKGRSPSFLVAALKDAMSGNLDENERCKTPVGSTVNVEKATWTNTIGDPELITVWTDPDFDPGQRAFYYVRVIEIPMPRWTAYEAMLFNIKLPKDVKMITQERPYTSPIWYTPNT